MPRRSFSILIAVWNFTFPAPLGNCGLRHAIFFSKFSCSYSFTHLCNIPFMKAPPNYTFSLYFSLNIFSNLLKKLDHLQILSSLQDLPRNQPRISRYYSPYVLHEYAVLDNMGRTTHPKTIFCGWIIPSKNIIIVSITFFRELLRYPPFSTTHLQTPLSDCL